MDNRQSAIMLEGARKERIYMDGNWTRQKRLHEAMARRLKRTRATAGFTPNKARVVDNKQFSTSGVFYTPAGTAVNTVLPLGTLTSSKLFPAQRLPESYTADRPLRDTQCLERLRATKRMQQAHKQALAGFVRADLAQKITQWEAPSKYVSSMDRAK